ncbi:DinB family protein [Kutzneria chonburiensis]|uniref:DinB family protein n=1 Tax=Kutzneria chonburiensis TaxID=1483604 RepID=A0ABV6N682_9PSEU|nr:DinB family protein [Kutzneria chonburiensis]
MDRQAVHQEMERARATFHELLDSASARDLRRRSAGTLWSNKQLLFHMLLGYLIVRALRNLVVLFSRLPEPVGRSFARLLNAVTVPFDVVNFAGAWLAGTILPRRLLAGLFDRVIAALHRRLDHESDATLARRMAYPTRWDPFFREVMTLAQVYHFPTQHFDFHRAQLTLSRQGRGGGEQGL